MMTLRTVRARSLPTHRLALLCILFALPAAALAVTASAEGTSGANLRPAMISVNFGGLHFLDDDMHDTYGMIPAVGLRLAKQMDERAVLFVDLQYGKDSGNPYETPDFHSQEKTELKLAPITFGARLNATNNPRFLFYFGLAARYLWMSEKGPWGSAWDDLAEPEYSGWGWGLRFLIGPEWRDPDGQFAVGFEASFGIQAVIIEKDRSERDLDLSGTDLRFYLSGLF